MAKTPFVRESDSVLASLRSARGEVLPYRQILDELEAFVRFSEAFVVSSLPRGGLQIVQPQRVPESLLRGYSREFHAHDRLTWRAIAGETPVVARDAWDEGQFESSRYRTEFMQPHGFVAAAAAQLAAPVLDGYPGAVHLYRTAEHGEFSHEDVERLAAFARGLDQAIVESRAARLNGEACDPTVLTHRPPVRQFILDANLNAPVAQADPAVLDDDRLRENILQDARRRIEHTPAADREIIADRVPLPDSRGDLWNFRVVTHRSYPALSDGPVVFFCLQPQCCDWSTLRQADFQADNEVSRLIPALKFMRDHFHRGPTLVEIAKTVHLSPFHFHRRFTELLGITPKHFLLDCQIQQAKQDLLARHKELPKIAKECGFAHQSHFTSRFKQATGLTPTRWRRLAQEVQKASQN
jgi:AraC-like DNA-binding protein